MTGIREIVFPPGVDGNAYLRPLRHSAWTRVDESGAAYRRAVTEDDPVRFALTYLRPSVTDRPTGVAAFSEAHLALADLAREWMTPTPGLDGVVLPRGGGKSTWLFRILPLWALAHGHRRVFLAVSLTSEQAELHLAGIRRDLAENRWLLHDFPELRRRTGPGAANTKRTVTVGGAALMARGLTGASLGIKSDDDRPDLIIGDDLQPPAERHTPAMKRTVEGLVVSGLLPMGDRTTRTVLCGTTTMARCLMHDVVLAALPEGGEDREVAPWIAAKRLRAHHWPAILDEGTAAERSLWPQRWSLDELHADREVSPQDFALNMSCRPEEAGARGYWRRDLIVYNPRRRIVRRVLYADVATTNNRRSDLTALVLVGLDHTGRRAVVEHAEAGRWWGRELLDRMWRLTEAMPETLREWVVETNQGGDRWLEILSPLPPGVELSTEHVTAQVHGSKRYRIEAALAHYQRGAVEHAMPQTQLEAQQLAWTPAADEDDLLDALAGGLRRVLG